MKKIISDDYFYGNTGNPAATQELLDFMPVINPDQLEQALVGPAYQDPRVELDHRKTKTMGITVDDHPIILGLEKIIQGSNKYIWKKDLQNKWDINMINYLLYEEPDDQFKWHVDNLGYVNGENDRVLSLSYCLSHASDYEGCEFCIGDEEFKMDFGDFIVFPSDVLHCVKPLISGRREVIVAWYY